MTWGGTDSGAVPGRVPLRQAKACFSEILARAELVGTVTILTKHGRPAAAVVPMTALDDLEDLVRLRAELAALRSSAIASATRSAQSTRPARSAGAAGRRTPPLQ